MDTIVTIRMPKTLLEELKKQTEKEFYTDLSEQIRSIVREHCLRHSDPVQQGLQQLETHLLHQLESKTETQRKEQLLQQLHELMRGEKQ